MAPLVTLDLFPRRFCVIEVCCVHEPSVNMSESRSSCKLPPMRLRRRGCVIVAGVEISGVRWSREDSIVRVTPVRLEMSPLRIILRMGPKRSSESGTEVAVPPACDGVRSRAGLPTERGVAAFQSLMFAVRESVSPMNSQM